MSTTSSSHSINPQNIFDKITRLRIYDCQFWKEECFGLTAETLVDKAIELKYIGGLCGGMRIPSPFICLVLKMLQIQPEKLIVLEFIKNEDFKYVRALGLFYLRLIGKTLDIYNYLEPCYMDYRKLRFRQLHFSIMHMDEFVDSLLRERMFCDVTLPSLIPRMQLEDNKLLVPRRSVLDDEVEAEIIYEENKPAETEVAN